MKNGLMIMFIFCMPSLYAHAQSALPNPHFIERVEEFPNKNSLDASIYRGTIVYHSYCVLCHGAKADGNGRAAKIYTPRPANLVTTDKNDAYKELIIRKGGAALGRSAFMPPWGEELTDEQIMDVVAFLRSIAINQAPGE